MSLIGNLFEDHISCASYLGSPFNYTGSKYRLLPQILPLFPEHDILMDMFCGGGSIAFNSSAKTIIANDVVTPLIDFYNFLKENSWENIIKEIKNRSKGFNKNNQDSYVNLRERYNLDKNCVDFFLLLCSCTNNMMRFNRKLEFNQTWGKRSYNSNTEEKLYGYWKKLQKQKIIFTNFSFDSVLIHKDAFVYLDPPYSITSAGYNLSWDAKKEQKLYDLLDKLHSSGHLFAMSNVSKHNGKTNPNIDRMKKYDIIELTFDYSKVSRIDTSKTQEVLVKNY